MSILDYEYVLAQVKRPSIWNFYPTLEAAAADAPRANQAVPFEPYVPMAYKDFQAAERAFYLAPAVQITAEKFDEMLNVLPPMRWMQEPDFNSFLMSEMWSGSYTHQYAKYGHGAGATYWQKMVDARERSTWMKRGECPTGPENPAVFDGGKFLQALKRARVDVGLDAKEGE